MYCRIASFEMHIHPKFPNYPGRPQVVGVFFCLTCAIEALPAVYLVPARTQKARMNAERQP